MQAAIEAGANPSTILMALAYGDQWTNLIQPFWALPLLGITHTRAADVMGYTAVLCAVTGVVFTTCCLLL